MCDNSNSRKLSRRNFLGNAFTLGAGTFLFDPVRALTEGIVDGLISQAQAESTGTQAGRNYVNIQLPGAPIRYQFDQWLRTSVNDPALKMMSSGLQNPMTCNSFDISPSGLVTPIYRTTTYRGMILPYMWSQTVFNSKGQVRPLTDLLNNMLVVRGFGSGLDGHQFNILIQQQPIGGVATINAVTTENSNTTFDAIQWPGRGDNGVFVSGKGKSQSKLAGTKPLSTLMEGFAAPTNKGVVNLKTKYADAMQLAQDRLKTYARSSNAGAAQLGQNLSNATDMIKKGVANLDGYWADAVARYKAAIEPSVQAINLPSLSDKPLVSDGS
ncbi:MAG TPA: hypothetical protein VN132_07820, partial [Bdellovibrio sp.]|nr:hypothetical protein [Bdellovibrio sp.]